MLGCDKERRERLANTSTSGISSSNSDSAKLVEGLEVRISGASAVGRDNSRGDLWVVSPAHQIDPELPPLAMPVEVIRGVMGGREPEIRHGFKHWEANFLDPARAFHKS